MNGVMMTQDITRARTRRRVVVVVIVMMMMIHRRDRGRISVPDRICAREYRV